MTRPFHQKLGLPGPTGSFIGVIIAITGRQRITEDVKRLPGRHWRRVIRSWSIHRVFDKLHLVDVARAVWKDFFCRNANNKYRARIFGAQRVIRADLRRAVNPYPLWSFEVQEQQPNVRVDQNISPSSIHSVTVVIRKRKGAAIEDSHEPRQATLI